MDKELYVMVTKTPEGEFTVTQEPAFSLEEANELRNNCLTAMSVLGYRDDLVKIVTENTAIYKLVKVD